MVTALSAYVSSSREASAQLEFRTERLLAVAGVDHAPHSEAVAETELLLAELKDQNWLDALEANLPQLLDTENAGVEMLRRVDRVLGVAPDRAGELGVANVKELRESTEKCRAMIQETCEHFCDLLTKSERRSAQLRRLLRALPSGRLKALGREVVATIDALCVRYRDSIRLMVVSAPELKLVVPDHLAVSVWTVCVSPRAYLWAMWNLFWSAIRHPFSETTIDLSTGRVLYRT